MMIDNETAEYLRASVRGGSAALLNAIETVVEQHKRIEKLEETVDLLSRIIDVLVEEQSA
jgi:hypothetical protein